MEVGRSLGMTIHRLNRINFENQSKALERLSSSLRINRASDDAAGLSISESLSSQVRGTHQAIRNAQDGINLLRTADGAFDSIHAMLQRMRELAVQGANSTLDLAARADIQMEMEQLKRQIDMTAYFTEYNGQKLLVSQDKTYRPTDMPYNYQNAASPSAWGNPASAESQLAGPGSSVAGVTWEELQAVKAMLPTLIEGAMRKAEGQDINSGIDHTTIVPTIDVYFVIDPTLPATTNLSNGNRISINLYSFFGSGVPASNPAITLQQAFAQGMGAVLMQREDANASAVFGDYNAWLAAAGAGNFDALAQFAHMGAGESAWGYGKPAAFSFDALGTDGGRSQAAWFYRYLTENYGQDAADQVNRLIVDNDTGSKGSIVASVQSYLLGLTGQTTQAGLAAAVQTWITAQPNPTTFTNNALANTASTSAQPLAQAFTLQIGANFGETVDLQLMAGALGNLDFVSMVSVMDQETAGRSITTIDRAIAEVSDARARLGAGENRLEHTINRLAVYEENAKSANSRVRDADIADEASALTRAQVMAAASLGSLKTFHSLQQEQTGALLSGLTSPGE